MQPPAPRALLRTSYDCAGRCVRLVALQPPGARSPSYRVEGLLRRVLYTSPILDDACAVFEWLLRRDLSTLDAHLAASSWVLHRFSRLNTILTHSPAEYERAFLRQCAHRLTSQNPPLTHRTPSP
jgi:hypothetical protein